MLHHRTQIILVGMIALAATFERTTAQTPPDEEVRKLVQSFKADERGPFQAIRWFYPDGSMRPSDQHVPTPGAIQHALHKDVVQSLAQERGIYLGQILAGTPNNVFLDAARGYARMKQYLLEKYLQAVDDGWIFRKARFYRGAYQAEDEGAWGKQFLLWLLTQDRHLEEQYFFIRQAARDLPHQADDDLLTRIRTVSKVIADLTPGFAGIRVKIHGQPDASDLERVRFFHERNAESLTPEIMEKVKALEKDLEAVYHPPELHLLIRYNGFLSQNSPVRDKLNEIASINRVSEETCQYLADLLWLIRIQILLTSNPKERLALMDLSLESEQILFRLTSAWQPDNLYQLITKSSLLCKAAAGCGFLEVWEWEQIRMIFQLPAESKILSSEVFQRLTEYPRRVSEWGAGMVQATYGSAVEIFSGFEPLAVGFIDDRIRGSILLLLGETAGRLGSMFQTWSGNTHTILDIPFTGGVRGLNPGVAMGELVIVTGSAQAVSFQQDKIVIFDTPPPDLKPVAGIASSSEGNLVSHVQLLARNLGIPNAVLPKRTVEALKPFAGQRVFYGVSPKGRVVIKRIDALSREEKNLIQAKKRSEVRIEVPMGKLDLTLKKPVSLRRIRASESGRICGPKAANLGELKYMFPEYVAEGIVIPFGVFRAHLDQTVPGSSQTYWNVLQAIFKRANRDRQSGIQETDVEEATLQRLARFQEMIRDIGFLPVFVDELKTQFFKNYGKPMGETPVFIRSDTNMEDLKDFTGAGLNLTVFNVVGEAAVLQGIRDVWASPYSERSYRWRQHYLVNPENVYPSLLILKTVNVDKSGVLITTGVTTSRPQDVTVAFNRGAGGAVEGQAAESWTIRPEGTAVLIAPSRQPTAKRLPKTGGVVEAHVPLHRATLSEAECDRLRTLAQDLSRRLPGMPGIETSGPFDVELGFQGDALWLFQVRPYVENKSARSLSYLQTLDASIPANRTIRLDQRLQDILEE